MCVFLHDITEARRQRTVLGEKAAAEMLAAETAKMGTMMSAPNANLDAVEAELRRWVVAGGVGGQTSLLAAGVGLHVGAGGSFELCRWSDARTGCVRRSKAPR